MYVCVCNVLTDRDVAAAAKAGSRSVDDVFRFHDCAAQCGKCMSTMLELLGGGPPQQDNDSFWPDSLAAE